MSALERERRNLSKATAKAESFSARLGLMDHYNSSDKARANMRRKVQTEWEAVRSIEHEVHCLEVEAGLIEPEPERYGDHTIRYAGNDWSVFRRAPRIGA